MGGRAESTGFLTPTLVFYASISCWGLSYHVLQDKNCRSAHVDEPSAGTGESGQGWGECRAGGEGVLPGGGDSTAQRHQHGLSPAD